LNNDSTFSRYKEHRLGIEEKWGMDKKIFGIQISGHQEIDLLHGDNENIYIEISHEIIISELRRTLSSNAIEYNSPVFTDNTSRREGRCPAWRNLVSRARTRSDLYSVKTKHCLLYIQPSCS
jgi:hypothetical protein